MKRLFIILLMNAWGGLRRMPGLSTAAMVLLSAMTLIVTSTITAGASPDLPLPSTSQQSTKHTISHPSAGSQTFAFLGVTSSPTLHPEKKVQQQPEQQDRVKQAATQQNGSNIASNPPTTESSQQNTPAMQAASAALSPLVVQQDCVQGQMTYSVKSAQLNFQTPTTVKSTVTWHWETNITNGTNTSGSAPANSAPDSQVIPANTSSATLTPSDGAPQMFSATASQSYAYSFRLDVLVNGAELTSDWYNVSQSASTCQQQQPAPTNNSTAK